MFSLTSFSRAAVAPLVFAAALSGCGGGGADAPAQAQDQVSVPTARPDQMVAAYNRATDLSVLTNDSATVGGAPTLVSVTTPAHGTAAIVGNTLTYTPTAGYMGTDTFSYTIKASGSGTATSTAEVSVMVAASLTMNGKVVDAPANAQVTIAIGNQSSTTTTDAAGNFTAQVRANALDDMVTITAQGTGAGAGHVKLISMLGDVRTVVGAVGAESTLTPAKLPGMKVSSVSTALYGMMFRNNGNVVPTSQQSLQTASRSVQLGGMLQMASIVRKVAGFGTSPAPSLPSGISDTLGLVLSSSNTYGAYAKTVILASSDSLQAENAALWADAKLVDVPPVVVTGTKTFNFYQNDNCCGSAAIEVKLNADGSASYRKEGLLYTGTWAKDDALTLTLTNNVKRAVNRELTPDLAGDVYYVAKSLKITQFTGFADEGVARIVESGIVENPFAGTSDETFSEQKIAAFSDWDRLTAPTDLAGVRLAGVLVLPYSSALQPVSQKVVSLSVDGKVSNSPSNVEVGTWAMQAGKFVINETSGNQQTYARISVSPDGIERWLVREGTPSTYNVFEIVMTRVQPGLSFAEAEVAGGYRSSLNSEILPDFIVSVFNNHTGTDRNLDFMGVYSGGRPTSWTLEGGMLVMRSFRGPDRRLYGACPAELTCTLNTERKWTLLSKNADAIVVLEDVTFAGPVSGVRVNRYTLTTAAPQ